MNSVHWLRTFIYQNKPTDATQLLLSPDHAIFILLYVDFLEKYRHRALTVYMYSWYMYVMDIQDNLYSIRYLIDSV